MFRFTAVPLTIVGFLYTQVAWADYPHGGYTGAFQGGYSGGTSRGYNGVNVGGYSGGNDRGFTGVHVGGAAAPNSSDRYQESELYFLRSLRSDRVQEAALIDVQVLPDASIWIEGKKMAQQGRLRQFISPTLKPGGNYVYHVRVRWTENKLVNEQSKLITVHAGDHVHLNFTIPASKLGK